MKNKVSSILLTITASAVLASVPAVAQLGGALGSTLGGNAQAQGNRGGLGGTLGVDHTLNGAARGQRGGLDLGSGSSMNGSLNGTLGNAQRDGNGQLGDVTKKTKNKV